MLASSALASARALRVYRFFEIAAARLEPQEFADAVAPFLFGATFHRTRPALVDDIVRSTRPSPATFELMRAQARALRAFDGRELTRTVRCPTLLIAGAEDSLTPPDEVRATAGWFAAGRYLEIPGAGHSLLLESPLAFEALHAFLAGGEPAVRLAGESQAGDRTAES
jgi:pimeloyl-ACP methyl ester carboxylesterase